MKIALINIPVKHPVAAAYTFYTTILGFQRKLFVPDANLAIINNPENPDVGGILLDPVNSEQSKQRQEKLFRANHPIIAFRTLNIREEYERLVKLGVQFRSPPIQTEDGLRAVFEDTCGNLVQLHQV